MHEDDLDDDIDLSKVFDMPDIKLKCEEILSNHNQLVSICGSFLSRLDFTCLDKSPFPFADMVGRRYLCHKMRFFRFVYPGEDMLKIAKELPLDTYLLKLEITVDDAFRFELHEVRNLLTIDERWDNPKKFSYL